MAFNKTGDVLYARRNSLLTAHAYDPATGAQGTELFPSIVVPQSSLGKYGIDQLAVTGNKLYVPTPNAVNVYASDTGDLLTTITDPAIVAPTGVCFAR